MAVNRNDAHRGQVITWEREGVIMSEKGRIQCASKMLGTLLKHTHTHKGKKMEGNTPKD